MVAWFKHDIPAWMDGTEALSDGAYRTYHVICQLIYLNEGPIALNEHGIAGRCRQSIRAFRRNLAELTEGKKLTLEGGRLANLRAGKELEKVGENRMNAAKGGIESGKSRIDPDKARIDHDEPNMNSDESAAAISKPLKTNEPDEATLREDRSLKTRLDKTKAAQPRDKTEFEILEDKLRATAGVENDPSPGLLVVGSISALIEAGYSLDADVIPTIAAKRTTGFKPRSWGYYVDAIRDARAKRLKIIERPAPQAVEPDWPEHATRYGKDQYWAPHLGPEPGMGGCRCPPELLEQNGIDPKTGMPNFLKRTA